MIPVIDRLVGHVEEKAGWRNLVNDKRRNIYIETKKSAAGLPMMRATGPIDFSPLQVFRAIEYGADKPEWDDSCDECFNVSRVGVNALSESRDAQKSRPTTTSNRPWARSTPRRAP